MERLLKSYKKDNLNVQIFTNEQYMSENAAKFVSRNNAIRVRGSANLILGPGHHNFLFGCIEKTNLDWSRITVFHLDEYIGFSDKHPASFRKYLKERILDTVKPGNV